MKRQEFNQSELVAQGWTKTAIERFLPEPEVRFGGKGNREYITYIWPGEVVVAARNSERGREYFDRLDARRKVAALQEEKALAERQKRLRKIAAKIHLVDAIREVSRAAHQERDKAQKYHQLKEYEKATASKKRKDQLYSMKERGIAAGYKRAELRYAGSSAQGMAVYVYGKGGLSCFHSRLHPAGEERTIITDHPEILFVPAKAVNLNLEEVETLLWSLPTPGEEFECSSRPSFPKSVTCFGCGQTGHVLRNCPNSANEPLE